MPLYTYQCTTCGADLEILHRVGRTRARCGLDCQRRDAGAFGRGEVQLVLAAANVATASRGLRPGAALAAAAASGTLGQGGDPAREALRQRALSHLGGDLTEGDLNRLRDKGVAVYRKDGRDGWSHTGGGSGDAPKRLKKPT
jgi:hypothetical protein